MNILHYEISSSGVWGQCVRRGYMARWPNWPENKLALNCEHSLVKKQKKTFCSAFSGTMKNNGQFLSKRVANFRVSRHRECWDPGSQFVFEQIQTI